jgi:hypothetical protein
VKGAVPMENSMFSQQIKSRITIQKSHFWLLI